MRVSGHHHRCSGERGRARADRMRAAACVAITALMLLLCAGCTPDKGQKKIRLADRMSDKEMKEHARKQDAGVLWFGFDLRSSPREDARQYIPFLKYLSEATGYRFELYFIPKGESIVDTLGRGKVQFAAVGACTYIQAHAKYGVMPLARGLNAEGKAVYRSVIVVRPRSSIRTIHDLRNKRLALGDVTSTQGHLIPRIILAMQGLTLDDLKSFEYTGSHRNCANAVLAGRADACGMQDTMGMELAQEGLVRIIYTSKEYPSSGIAANRNVPPLVLAKVREALLNFDPAGRHAAGLYHWDKTEMPKGFTAAHDGDYAELREWTKKLGYFPDIRPEALP
jgi:phosphonate transport system substrate-binding protein